MKSCNANDFCSRKHYCVSKEKWKEYMEYEEIKFDGEFLDKDSDYIDYEKYNWKMVYQDGSDGKYGRILVSEEYGLRRKPTIEEFYGNSFVD